MTTSRAERAVALFQQLLACPRSDPMRRRNSRGMWWSIMVRDKLLKDIKRAARKARK